MTSQRYSSLPISIAFVLLLTTACHHKKYTTTPSPVRIIAFFTAKNDRAHISFVNEANQWFDCLSRNGKLIYDTTSDWSRLNDTTLTKYDLVLFLDTRPETTTRRSAFERYMKRGGAWIGFHFSGFALSASAYPQNWDWYHREFIGADQYKSNTWRPTSATLRVMNTTHPTSTGLRSTFLSAPNEWYSWTADLRNNKQIDILLAIDSSSFPLGTGPKQHEIWKSGFYPVAWTNKNYRMVYINMGHNDIDYETGSNKQLSQTFASSEQNTFLLNCINWLHSRRRGNSPADSKF